MSPTPKAPPKPAEPEPFFARLVAAKAAVSGVAKDGRNTQQNYDFTSVEGVLRAVRGPLAEHGINLSVSATKLERQKITSGRGAEGERLTVYLNFTFRDVHSDAETVHPWIGVGEDFGDKAIGKAYSAAIKTFVLAEWQLPKGDDPEADKHIPVVELPWYAAAAPTDEIAEFGRLASGLVGRDVAAGLVKRMRADNGGEVSHGQVRALLALLAAIPADAPLTAEQATAQLAADLGATPVDPDADAFVNENAAIDAANGEVTA